MMPVVFCGLNVKHDIEKGKLPALLVVSFFLIQFFFSGAGNYLLEHGQKMQVLELFSFSLTSPIPYLFFFFGMLFLLSGVPRVGEDTLFYLIRSGRIVWLAGQYLFILLITVVYLLWLFLCFLVALKWQVSFTNEWSQPAILVCQTNIVQNIGININVWFPYELIQNYTPLSLFLTEVLVQLLLFFMIGSLLVCLRLCGLHKIPYIIIMVLWMQSFLFQQFDVKPVFFKLCPVGASWPVYWDYGYLKGAPTIRYVLCFYIFFGALLVLLSMRQMKQVDMSEIGKNKEESE